MEVRKELARNVTAEACLLLQDLPFQTLPAARPKLNEVFETELGQDFALEQIGWEQPQVAVLNTPVTFDLNFRCDLRQDCSAPPY
eukprot:1418584-Rhodomonas_salina.4